MVPRVAQRVAFSPRNVLTGGPCSNMAGGGRGRGLGSPSCLKPAIRVFNNLNQGWANFGLHLFLQSLQAKNVFCMCKWFKKKIKEKYLMVWENYMNFLCKWPSAKSVADSHARSCCLWPLSCCSGEESSFNRDCMFHKTKKHSLSGPSEQTLADPGLKETSFESGSALGAMRLAC